MRIRGHQGLCNCPRLRIPSVSSLECNVGRRKQTSSASMATQLSSEKRRDFWSHDLSMAGATVMPREGPVHPHEVFTCFYHFDLITQHQLQGQFLNNDAFLLLHIHPTKEGHSSMTLPKVTWSVVFSEIVWCETTGWENVKICISLKRDAILELLIEKKLKLQGIKGEGAHQRKGLILRHMVSWVATARGGQY